MRDPSCPNCGNDLVAKYCAACGQLQARDSPTFFQVIRDVAGEFTDLDSRVWLTFRTLLLHPGAITRDYMDHKRARYLSPFRLYLLTNVVLYFVINWFDGGVRVGLGIDLPQTNDDGARFFDPGAAGIVPQVGFVMLPFLAWGLMLLYLHRHLTFGDHFVTALHLKSVIATVIALAAVFNGMWTLTERLFQLDLPNIGGRLILIVMPICVFYVITSLQRTYGGKVMLNILRAAVLLPAYFFVASGVVFGVAYLLYLVS